jgi:hypothetical protein
MPAVIIISGCGDELQLSQFPTKPNTGHIGDTVYIPQTPVITGFNSPVDIYTGHEPLLYVADRDNNRIVQMDISGNVVSYSDFILKPRKITQDRNFDLLVVASKIDTIPPNIPDTVDAVFRFKLHSNGGVISNVHPSVTFKANQPTPIPGSHRHLTAIASFSNNYYLVARSGPDNTSPIDPDNAIFKIDRFDNTYPVPERLPGFELEGQGLLSLLQISSISALSFNNTDLLYTQIFPDEAFKTQWAIYDAVNGTYIPKFTPGAADILRPGLFTLPQGITVDQYGNIYVIDSQKDSLYKFNSLGKLKRESFGGAGSSPSQFNSPYGIAFFNKTLFICDTGNNRLLRFILSTDIH